MTLGSSELRAHASGLGEELALPGCGSPSSPARPRACWPRPSAGARPACCCGPRGRRTTRAWPRTWTSCGAWWPRSTRRCARPPDAACARRQATLEAAVRRRARHARGERATAASERAPRLAARWPPRSATARSWSSSRSTGRLHAVSLARPGAAARARSGGTSIADAESLRFGLRSLATRGRARPRRARRRLRDRRRRGSTPLLLRPARGDRGPRRSCSCPPASSTRCPGRRCPALAAPAAHRRAVARLWWRASGDTPPPDDPRSGARRRPAPARGGGGRPLSARYPAAPRAHRRRRVRRRRRRRARRRRLGAPGHARPLPRRQPAVLPLNLADGPVTVHDIERLGTRAARLILSSCESGLSAVPPGDELMGLTAALFALGTTTVVAASSPSPTTRRAPDDRHARRARRGRRRRGARHARDALARDDRDTPSPTRVRLLRRRLTTLRPVKTKPVRQSLELVLTIAVALFFALTIQAFAVKPYLIALRCPRNASFSASTPGSGSSSTASATGSAGTPPSATSPSSRPRRAPSPAQCGTPARPALLGGESARAADEAHPRRRPTRRSSSAWSACRGTRSGRRGHVVRNGRKSEPYAAGCGGAEST